MDNAQEGTIKEVLNDGQPVSTGYSEKTKANWAKYKILSNDDITAFGFGPVKVGDKIQVWDDEQYGMQFKVLRPDKHEEVMKALKYVAAQNKKILDLLSNGGQAAVPIPSVSGKEEPAPAADPPAEELHGIEKARATRSKIGKQPEVLDESEVPEGLFDE